jgi:ribosome-associated translation inhibitor RaiA
VTDHASIVERSLRVHGHLDQHELQGLHKHWANLDRALRPFDSEAIDIQLFISERDTPSQHVTLELHLPGHRTLVASAARPDLGAALHEVREALIRQLGDLKRSLEPRHSREIRSSGRHR